MKDIITQLLGDIAGEFIPILCQIGGLILIGLGGYGIIRCISKGNLRKSKIILCLIGLSIGFISLKFNAQLSQWFIGAMM